MKEEENNGMYIQKRAKSEAVKGQRVGNKETNLKTAKDNVSCGSPKC